MAGGWFILKESKGIAVAYCSHDDFYGRGFNGTKAHWVLDFKGIQRRRLLYQFLIIPARCIQPNIKTQRWNGNHYGHARYRRISQLSVRVVQYIFNDSTL